MDSLFHVSGWSGNFFQLGMTGYSEIRARENWRGVFLGDKGNEIVGGKAIT